MHLKFVQVWVFHVADEPSRFGAGSRECCHMSPLPLPGVVSAVAQCVLETL